MRQRAPILWSSPEASDPTRHTSIAFLHASAVSWSQSPHPPPPRLPAPRSFFLYGPYELASLRKTRSVSAALATSSWTASFMARTRPRRMLCGRAFPSSPSGDTVLVREQCPSRGGWCLVFLMGSARTTGSTFHPKRDFRELFLHQSPANNIYALRRSYRTYKRSTRIANGHSKQDPSYTKKTLHSSIFS